MLSDISRATGPMMGSGARSESSFGLQRVFLRLLSMLKTNTSRPVIRAFRNFLDTAPDSSLKRGGRKIEIESMRRLHPGGRASGLSFACLVFFGLLVLLGSTNLGAQNGMPPAAPNPPPPPGYTPPGQQADQSHRIKASVDLVVLHVTVTDESGQFVSDLKKTIFVFSRTRSSRRFRCSRAKTFL